MNRLAIYLLAFGSFLMGTAEFVVAGILDTISKDLDISISLAGQLVTVYSLSFAFGSFALVLFTSKFDRKKVLLSTIIVFLMGNMIAFFSYHFELLMLSRIVLAVSGGLYTVVATNFAAKITSPEQKGSAIATVITGFSVSLVLGVPIGTLIAAYMDWRYIFMIIAIVTFLLLISIYNVIPQMKGTAQISIIHQLQIIKDKRVISALLTTLFWILGYTMLFTYISSLLQKFAGFSIELVSLCLLILGVFAFLGSRFGGYAVDKWGSVRTISISLIIHATALFLITNVLSTFALLLAVIMIWGAAAWTTTPANQFYLILLQPKFSETVLSFNTTIMNIGMTLGAGLGGLVIEYKSILHLGWIGGLMVMTAFITTIYSFLLNKKKELVVEIQI
ncbi:MFS transporter [Shimazuella alba]|uniref:MFS transporter n=1 Tax=Shimazuella alba TaxID=2690964 RepID=A0A6I4VYF8_9BACL|nr:MFS transporter [Shimazuella alba]MXQ53102.1 MFS transporter [Shimazuella alba]